MLLVLLLTGQALAQTTATDLWGMRGLPDPLPPSLPFVDRFGQYMHHTWPGKLKDETELAARTRAEAERLAARTRPADRDAYGGWTGMPPREATGWFRTEQVDGRWWLITPAGHVFFSLGVDSVGTWERTFIEGRQHWFAWLPPRHDPIFGPIYGSLSGAHSMADPIQGQGEVFSFYTANLARKYGGAWSALWRRDVYRRLDAWSFNTLGNWTEADVLAHSPMPYVASAAIHGVSEIAGAEGYWARMMDVFDPSFEKQARAAVAGIAREHRDRPLCIGYFIDNELAWEGVARGALRSPASQPARVAMLETLRQRHASLEALNTAWGTAYADWDQLTAPEQINEACQNDLDAFLFTFAQRYFRVVASAVREHAPRQLYLGCRFASTPAAAVRACAEFADVVSFNYYKALLTPDLFAGLAPHNKPCVIGEFHFGATDHGMFHPGLGPTNSQAERAAAYTAYVESALAIPCVVGTHWFQYTDEPITGRWFDGENYNIGLVDVTDTPYPELIEAATSLHRNAYQRRVAP